MLLTTKWSLYSVLYWITYLAITDLLWSQIPWVKQTYKNTFPGLKPSAVLLYLAVKYVVLSLLITFLFTRNNDYKWAFLHAASACIGLYAVVIMALKACNASYGETYLPFATLVYGAVTCGLGGMGALKLIGPRP